MDKRQLTELLDRHAEQLQRGLEAAPELLASAPPEGRGTLEALFSLAGRLKTTLKPVSPRPAFVAQLKTRLGASQSRSPAHLPQPRLIWIAAGVGGLLYVLSLVMLTFRAALLGKGLIFGIIANRAVRPALPKVEAQPVP